MIKQCSAVPLREFSSSKYLWQQQCQLHFFGEIHNLSKGYRQRVGIAQTLIGNPEVIILDEPTVGLDPSQVIEIRKLITNLSKNHTIIFSSHILSEVQAICDRVIIINNGKLVADAPTIELSAQVEGNSHYLLTVEG